MCVNMIYDDIRMYSHPVVGHTSSPSASGICPGSGLYDSTLTTRGLGPERVPRLMLTLQFPEACEWSNLEVPSLGS